MRVSVDVVSAALAGGPRSDEAGGLRISAALIDLPEFIVPIAAV